MHKTTLDSSKDMRLWQYKILLGELQQLELHGSSDCPCLLNSLNPPENCVAKHSLNVSTLAAETALMDSANAEVLYDIADEATDLHEKVRAFMCQKGDLPDFETWARNTRKQHIEPIYYSCKVKLAEALTAEDVAKMFAPLEIDLLVELAEQLILNEIERKLPTKLMIAPLKEEGSMEEAEMEERTKCEYKKGDSVWYRDMPCQVVRVARERGQCYYTVTCIEPCYPKETSMGIIPTSNLKIRTDGKSLTDYLFPTGRGMQEGSMEEGHIPKAIDVYSNVIHRHYRDVKSVHQDSIRVKKPAKDVLVYLGCPVKASWSGKKCGATQVIVKSVVPRTGRYEQELQALRRSHPSIKVEFHGDEGVEAREPELEEVKDAMKIAEVVE